jgi:hypothetical protein
MTKSQKVKKTNRQKSICISNTVNCF